MQPSYKCRFLLPIRVPNVQVQWIFNFFLMREQEVHNCFTVKYLLILCLHGTLDTWHTIYSYYTIIFKLVPMSNGYCLLYLSLCCLHQQICQYSCFLFHYFSSRIIILLLDLPFLIPINTPQQINVFIDFFQEDNEPCFVVQVFVLHALTLVDYVLTYSSPI